MSILLALENELHKRIKYSIGSSAVVLRLAEDFAESGLVSEDVNVVVKFLGSRIATPNTGANTPTVRLKEIDYSVKVIYKNSQRHGHSFALAMLDSISAEINGYVPNLSESVGKNNQDSLPVFQTGFELVSEVFSELSDASQYIYDQVYSIKLILPQGELSPLSCPIDYDQISLAKSLPCKRCLKTKDGIIIGIAEWSNAPGGNCTTPNIFLIDKDYCKTRPGDILNVTLGERYETLNGIPFVYTVVYIEFIPFEAISYDPENGRVVNQALVTTSELKNFYHSPDGTLPPYCSNLQIVFGVYADFAGKVDSNPSQYKLGDIPNF